MMLTFARSAATLAAAAVVVLIALPALAADSVTLPGAVVAHEWGTFTTVAGADGNPVRWRPLASSDLPCFVERLGPYQVKSRVATSVRMETPVVYFYAPGPAKVSVQVDFPQGLITEWYPKASALAPSKLQEPAEARGGRIEWNNIELLPSAAAQRVSLPSTKGDSHYYPARETDAMAIRVNGQVEKMLFYRGVADFGVPVQAKFDDAGRRLQFRNTSSAVLPVAVYFENRGGGKAGFRIARDVSGGAIEWQNPELRTGGIAEVQQALASELVRAGLYSKEASAMIETWRDSWFEAGSRVFYLVPRKLVDEVLPMRVEPAASAIERVFVGRVELLPPWLAEELPNVTDPSVLAGLGRFLDPFAEQILQSRGKRLNMTAYRAASQQIWDTTSRNGGCVR